MKRLMFTAIMAVAFGASGLMAQQGQAQAQAAGPRVKSQKEAQAVMALSQAQSQGPDQIIKAAEDLLTNFADTQFKEIALSLEAASYQQKGDWAKAEILYDRVLEINPKSTEALRQIADITITHTHENDLDRDEKLNKAEKNINEAMDLLKTQPKPNPQIPDAQWEENKKYMIAQAENDLGLAALLRKKWDDAIADFKLALQGDPQPAYQVRLASAYQKAGKNDDAVAICDKLMADPQTHPAIRQFAQAIRAAAIMAAKGPAQAKP
jgi:tetratricopeptide (TPR) repeat protein